MSVLGGCYGLGGAKLKAAHGGLERLTKSNTLAGLPDVFLKGVLVSVAVRLGVTGLPAPASVSFHAALSLALERKAQRTPKASQVYDEPRVLHTRPLITNSSQYDPQHFPTL